MRVLHSIIVISVCLMLVSCMMGTEQDGDGDGHGYEENIPDKVGEREDSLRENQFDPCDDGTRISGSMTSDDLVDGTRYTGTAHVRLCGSGGGYELYFDMGDRRLPLRSGELSQGQQLTESFSRTTVDPIQAFCIRITGDQPSEECFS